MVDASASHYLWGFRRMSLCSGIKITSLKLHNSLNSLKFWSVIYWIYSRHSNFFSLSSLSVCSLNTPYVKHVSMCSCRFIHQHICNSSVIPLILAGNRKCSTQLTCVYLNNAAASFKYTDTSNWVNCSLATHTHPHSQSKLIRIKWNGMALEWSRWKWKSNRMWIGVRVNEAKTLGWMDVYSSTQLAHMDDDIKYLILETP